MIQDRYGTLAVTEWTDRNLGYIRMRTVDSGARVVSLRHLLVLSHSYSVCGNFEEVRMGMGLKYVKGLAGRNDAVFLNDNNGVD